MGFLDKLKDAGKSMIAEATAKVKANTDTVYLDDFIQDGRIQGESLPQTKNGLCFRLDVKNNELVIVERIPSSFGTKNKLIEKISLDDIVGFRSLKKERKDLPNFAYLSYETELTRASGECYQLWQGWLEHPTDTRSSLSEEIGGIVSLNTVLLLFASMVSDDNTKQWYNEIYAERGTEPVFDENGNMDINTYVDMHNAWFSTQKENWEERMRMVQD